ncbi:hypothetical protein H6G96_20520 [Nostoc sp. FACHB-892]|jgi:hypothetical protein|uniref:hypothetical protein n=1 Tax=unclassified Nostoc TaxID=2593658 RepID=UPI00168580B0|nr:MULTISPECIES: hypothetical protein [unclassified Nostoc]MBD2246996.1 hypothetical protein [Nostoc sp. FACHB-888]MBD2728639.1 hypothetical protein [Nostoc sp. FACHB-892]
MKSIETIATVTKDGKITAQLPLDIAEGEHQVIIVIDEKLLTEETENKEKKAPLKFSAYPVGLVSESLTFRREDLYAND